MCFMDHKAQSSIGDSLPNKAKEGKLSKLKEKRRNNEKRKEKSRDAARCRRSRETEIFNELGETLPIRKDELDNLDKASVMRLAIAALKIEDMMKLFKINSDAGNPTQIVSKFDENAVMNALDGFFIALSVDGDVTYVSENIHEYIGIQQIDMIGNPIWDYTHQCDHTELREILNFRRLEVLDPDKTLNVSGKMSRNALIRIKCTLTSRGRNVNIKSASYKVINIVGHTVVDEQQRHHQFIGIARLVPHPSNIEVPLDSRTFLSKHSLNMKFSYVDDKMLSILGYRPNDLLEKSLYEYHHGADSEMLMNAFKNVINKGQTETTQYRFLGRNGGFCWVVSQATLVYDKQKPQSVVCVNYVISGLVNENEVYSLRQLEAFNTLPQNNKVKIVERQIEFKLENIQIESKNGNYQKQPDLDDKNNFLKTIDAIENTKSIKLDRTIQRVFLANHLNITPIKGNPKAVTASVFKALPTLKQKLILLNNINAQRANKPAPQSSKHITSPFMKSESVDIIESFGRVHSTISEPSILPRQTVVTASLFQPRRERTETVFSNPSTDLYLTESMNKTFSHTNDDKCQITSLKPTKDVDQVRDTTPSALSSNSATSQKAIFSTNFGMLNKPLSLNTTNENSLLSLGESTPLFGEIFDELILPEGYCTLLPEEIQSIDEQAGKINIDGDFINYAEGRNVSPGKLNNVMVSSNISKSSECSNSLPSLCSPNTVSRNEEFTFMSTGLDNDDIDLSMRAPYIPMNENDDLPLLTEDLMWSAFSDEVSLHKDIKTSTSTEFKSRPSQPQPIMPESMDPNLINDVQKTLSSIDSRFVSPILNSCINTKYIDGESVGTNRNKSIEKQFRLRHVQRESPMKNTGCGNLAMINNLISIESEDMLMKEPIAECGLESTAVINLKDDDYSSQNKKVRTYPIQNDAFIKNCADNILLQWTTTQSTENDVSGNGKMGRDPPTHIFPCEVQSEKSEPNIMNDNHKRCSSLEIGVIKRLRSHVNSDYSNLNEIENIQEHNSSPKVNEQSKNLQNSHLLQQLMAPNHQRNVKIACSKSTNFEEKMKESVQRNPEELKRSEDSVLKNLLCNDMTSSLSVTKTPDCRSYGSNMMQQIQMNPENVKMEKEVNCIENNSLNMYGLIEDVYLIDELNLIPTDPIEGNQSTFFVDNNLRRAVSSTVSEKRPLGSFEKQITISVPQPPPLKAEAFTIGGGLFQGITDHINILPTSLISPMEKDSIKSNSNNRMDIWTSELE